MQFVTRIDRCNLKHKSCRKYDEIKLLEMCRKFRSQIPVISNIFQSIEPKLECPLKAQNYTIKDAEIALDIFSKLPIGNYLWIFKLQMILNRGSKNNSKKVTCSDVEVTIIDKWLMYFPGGNWRCLNCWKRLWCVTLYSIPHFFLLQDLPHIT